MSGRRFLHYVAMRKTAPTKAESDLLPDFETLPLECIVVPATLEEFEAAAAEIKKAGVVGFDTESKPTFAKGEASQGPHVVQFATLEKAFIFQTHQTVGLPCLMELLCSDAVKKVGFGLKSDHGQIHNRLGVTLAAVLDLNHLFHDLGYGNSMGVRAGVALALQRNFHKSKKVTTTNWAASRLSAKQLLYAANDAYAALKVLKALENPEEVGAARTTA
jgi:ribonuclease D